MANIDVINRSEIEPRLVKPVIPNPLSIKSMSNGIPEASLLLTSENNIKNINNTNYNNSMMMAMNRRPSLEENYMKNRGQLLISNPPRTPKQRPGSRVTLPEPSLPQATRVTNTCQQQIVQVSRTSYQNAAPHNHIQQQMHAVGRSESRQTPAKRVQNNNSNGYSPDLRLKFYQKVQGAPNNVSENVSSRTQQHLQVQENANYSSSTRGMMPRTREIVPSVAGNNPRRVFDESVKLLDAGNVLSGDCRNRNDKMKMEEKKMEKEKIQQLSIMVKNQATLIESLKMHVISLMALHKEKLKNKKILTMKRDENSKALMSKNHQVTQSNKSTSCTILENKISVGVMTSLEFTLQNKKMNSVDNEKFKHQQKFNSEGSQNKRALPGNYFEQRHDDLNQQPFFLNDDNRQANGYDQSPLQNRDQQLRRTVNLEHSAAMSSFNLQDKYNGINGINDNEMFQSTVQPKIGWTFYNNILCQVNEILNTSHDIRQPTQHLYNTIMKQKSTARQLKIFETKITDMNDKFVSTNFNQKITATVDSSYYPKVNYQTNVVPSADSVTDSNTSFHMRALALKYLNNKNYSESILMNEQLIGRMKETETGQMSNMSMRTRRNYVENHAMTLNENSFINLEGRRNYHQNNILDMSVLKQQPKLL